MQTHICDLLSKTNVVCTPNLGHSIANKCSRKCIMILNLKLHNSFYKALNDQNCKSKPLYMGKCPWKKNFSGFSISCAVVK